MAWKSQRLAIPYGNQSFLEYELASVLGRGGFRIEGFSEDNNKWRKSYWTANVSRLLTERETGLICRNIGQRYSKQTLPIHYGSGEDLWEALLAILGNGNFIIDSVVANHWTVMTTRPLTQTEVNGIKEKMNKRATRG